jgi:hypothetical protein
MIVSDPRVLVADGNGEKFEVSLGSFKISGLQKVPFSNMIKLIIMLETEDEEWTWFLIRKTA